MYFLCSPSHAHTLPLSAAGSPTPRPRPRRSITNSLSIRSDSLRKFLISSFNWILFMRQSQHAFYSMRSAIVQRISELHFMSSSYLGHVSGSLSSPSTASLVGFSREPTRYKTMSLVTSLGLTSTSTIAPSSLFPSPLSIIKSLLLSSRVALSKTGTGRRAAASRSTQYSLLLLLFARLLDAAEALLRMSLVLTY